jgi:basic membrane protein A
MKLKKSHLTLYKFRDTVNELKDIYEYMNSRKPTISCPNIQRGWIVILFFLVISSFFSADALEPATHQPYRIGVLLPASGDSAMDFHTTLSWITEELNREGVGRTIELVSIDTSNVPIDIAARSMIMDPSIQVVIGPATSDEVIQISPEFIKAGKLLISPSATAEEISHQFNPTGYIWRTISGDHIQTEIIMNILSGRGAETVAILCDNTTYGKTFYDWAKHYAIKYKLNLTARVPFEHGTNLSGPVASAIAHNPDYLIVAAPGSDAAQVSRIIGENPNTVRLFFTDAGRTQTFPDLAGIYAEGAEGISPTADKKTGFFISYMEQFGKMPPDYAAPTYDALIIAVATLARMDAAPSENPDEALSAVVSGREISAYWDYQGAARAIRLIQAGKLPDITGASGPLEYYPQQGADPVTTWYVHWRVEEGEFLADTYIPGSMQNESEDSPLIFGNEQLIPFDMAEDDTRKVVSFVYTGEKGDFGFTDQAYLGLLKARKDMNLLTRDILLHEYLPEPNSVIDEMIGNRAFVIVFLGSNLAEYAQWIALQYPDCAVIVIDADPIPMDNIKMVSFTMNGASYLAGVLAANQSVNQNIGVIAARELPVISSFIDGFNDGAKMQDPDILINVTYLAEDNSGFTMPDNAAMVAEDMYRNGTDIIFTVAGGSGLGAITAAKQLNGLKIIGVDSDQSYLGPGVVIASVVKNLEDVVYTEITEALRGSYEPGVVVYGLSSGGSSLVINPRFNYLSSIIENQKDAAAEQEKLRTF